MVPWAMTLDLALFTAGETKWLPCTRSAVVSTLWLCHTLQCRYREIRDLLSCGRHSSKGENVVMVGMYVRSSICGQKP